jgi:transcriptional regulator with XRE-family HTH domain
MSEALPHLAENVRRLMARNGLTIAQLVHRSGLDERTIKSLLAGTNDKPHARTLHHLAKGLAAETDELFDNPVRLALRRFDRQTNPVVDDVIADHPRIFDGWSVDEFDELYSRFGTGGPLTADGALAAATAMNRKRQIHDRVALILETGEAELLAGFVDLLYGRVTHNGCSV